MTEFPDLREAILRTLRSDELADAVRGCRRPRLLAKLARAANRLLDPARPADNPICEFDIGEIDVAEMDIKSGLDAALAEVGEHLVDSSTVE